MMPAGQCAHRGVGKYIAHFRCSGKQLHLKIICSALVREMLSGLDAIHFPEMTNQNRQRGVLRIDAMDEGRVHGPVDVSYGPRREAWIERDLLVNQRKPA